MPPDGRTLVAVVISLPRLEGGVTTCGTDDEEGDLVETVGHGLSLSRKSVPEE